MSQSLFYETTSTRPFTFTMYNERIEQICQQPVEARSGITVIIPLYNHEKYISDAIKSVIDQTIPADEIIVIDDGSSDGSADIVRSLATKHSVIRFSSRPNRGAHETINEGINAASGDFIATLNSDDVYHPRRLEICLCELRKSKTARAVFTGVRILDSCGSPTNAPWYEAAIARYRNGTKLWLALLWANFFMTTSNVFVRREVFAEHGNGLVYLFN